MQITLRNLQKKIPIPKAKIQKAAKAALRKLKFTAWDISIVFVGGARMRSLNKKYLNHDYITDVLTFDLGSNQGEIIICPQVAKTNARVNKVSTDIEIVLYVIHGILHLAGYDDKVTLKKIQMQRMENLLLGSL